ncbi:Putative fucosyltransferase, partial [Durusdinium trenchii]
WSRAAESGLRFYASGSSTGAALTEPVESRAESARNDLQTAAVLAAELDATEACGPNASLAQRLFWLLLQSREDGRKRIAEGHALDPEMSLLSPEPSWVELLHSGWPVFSLAALAGGP